LLYAGGRPLVRDALTSVLGSSDFDVAVARSIPEAHELLQTPDPAPAVLLDDDVAGEAMALEAVGAIRRSLPGTHVGVLSASTLPLYPAQLLRAGASAFLTKDMPITELAGAVGRFWDGELVVDPTVARTMFSVVGEARDASPAADSRVNEIRLTPMERKVMELAAEGLLVKQIALQLDLSPLTVKNHLARIRRRLGATDKAHAVATALRAGLLR
jgi:DNA-binding NarL/FixJ family response regulator